jgi:proteasome accessory factor B/proteasome accessory factor C
VLQLLLMLIGAGRPVSRAEIFEAIAAYRTKVPAAGERKFERDKKELRELGVPIEEPEEDPNTYQVRRRAYELPELHLEEDERAALALAAEALACWEGLAYRDLVEEALRKLSYATGLTGPAKAPPHLAVALPIPPCANVV